MRHPMHAAAVRSWWLHHDELGHGRIRSFYYALRAANAWRHRDR